MIPNECNARSICRLFIRFALVLCAIGCIGRGRADTTTLASATSSLQQLLTDQYETTGFETSPTLTPFVAASTPSPVGQYHHPAHHRASDQQHHQASGFQPPQLPTFKFRQHLYNVSIRENSVGKTYAQQPTSEPRMGVRSAGDIDIKYRIIAGDKDKLFKAEERTVGDFTFLAIRTRTGNVVLNREKADVYHLKVRATGTRRDYKAKIIQEDECLVTVHVLDTNDLSPLFYPNEYAKTVPEDTPLHQEIVRVMAEDADLGVNGEIYYSFLDDNEWFSVHPSSGVVTLTRPLKYIDKSYHELIVIAVDRGSIQASRHSQPSKAKVKIRVEQVRVHCSVILD